METTDTTPTGTGTTPGEGAGRMPLPPPAFVYRAPEATPEASPEHASGDLDEDTFDDVAAQHADAGPEAGAASAPAAPPAPVTRAPAPAHAAATTPHKGRGRGLWVFVGICVLLVVVLAGFGIWFMRQVSPPGAPGDEVSVEIPAGMGRTELVDTLADRGVVTSPWAFSLYTKLNTPPEVKAGNYLFHAPSSFGDVYRVLAAPPAKKTYKVTFPEGFTVRQVTERVAAQVPGISAEQFNQALNDGKVRSKYMPPGAASYEGFLFPDTYVFEEGMTADDIIARMVTRFDEVADEVGLGAVTAVSPYDAVKIASMIEKEAELDEDRPKISRVIYNRLAAHMPLGVDATFLYALPPGTNPANVNWKTSNPYNTRVRTGMPPTPIANPGRASLEAAVHPADGPWLYYVQTDKDGRHAFTTTLQEHNAATADAKARGVF